MRTLARTVTALLLLSFLAGCGKVSSKDVRDFAERLGSDYEWIERTE